MLGIPPVRGVPAESTLDNGSTFVSYTGTEPGRGHAGPPPVGVAGGAAKSVTISHSASGACSSRGLRLGPTIGGICSADDDGPTRLTGLNAASSLFVRKVTWAIIRRGPSAASEPCRVYVDTPDASSFGEDPGIQIRAAPRAGSGKEGDDRSEPSDLHGARDYLRSELAPVKHNLRVPPQRGTNQGANAIPQ